MGIMGMGEIRDMKEEKRYDYSHIVTTKLQGGLGTDRPKKGKQINYSVYVPKLGHWML